MLAMLNHCKKFELSPLHCISDCKCLSFYGLFSYLNLVYVSPNYKFIVRNYSLKDTILNFVGTDSKYLSNLLFICHFCRTSVFFQHLRN